MFTVRPPMRVGFLAVTCCLLSALSCHAAQGVDDHACGVRAVRRVLEIYGTSVEFDSLYQQMHAEPDVGVSVRDVADCLGCYGLYTAVVTVPRDGTLRWRQPVIVYADAHQDESLGHFFVVESSETNRMTVWDGIPGLSSITRRACASRGPQKVYIVTSADPIDDPAKAFSYSLRFPLGLLVGGCVLLLAVLSLRGGTLRALARPQFLTKRRMK